MQPPSVRAWVRMHGFQAEKQKLLLIPSGSADAIAGAVVGLGPAPDLSEPTLWTSAGLPDRLPPGPYRFAGSFSTVGATHLALGWEYGAYRFSRYRKAAGGRTSPPREPRQHPGSTRSLIARAAPARIIPAAHQLTGQLKSG